MARQLATGSGAGPRHPFRGSSSAEHFPTPLCFRDRRKETDMVIKVGINGFGRIGRQAFKAISHNYADEMQVVGINDLFPPESFRLLLKYDSIYGRFRRHRRDRERRPAGATGTRSALPPSATRPRCPGVSWASTSSSSPPGSLRTAPRPRRTSKRARKRSSSARRPPMRTSPSSWA